MRKDSDNIKRIKDEINVMRDVIQDYEHDIKELTIELSEAGVDTGSTMG